MPESALERKLRSGPKPAETLDAFARACEVGIGAALNYPVQVSGSEQGEMTARDAVQEMAEGGMVLLLDAPDGGLGALIIPPALAAGLIELLTFGALSTHPVSHRAATATDAAVIEPVVRALLMEVAARREGAEAPMQFGALLSAQHFARVMPEGALDAYSVEVMISPERAGRLWLLTTKPIPKEPEPDPEADARWRGGMAENVTGSTVRVDVMLGPLQVSLAEMSEWQIGTVLTLGIEVLEAAEVQINGSEALGRARVGRLGGLRAIRLETDGDAPEPTAPPEEPALPTVLPSDTEWDNENGEDVPISPI